MKNNLLLHPNGGTVFGCVVGVDNPHYTILGGDVVLKNGIEKGAQGSFGAEHIWHRHSAEITPMGYISLKDVPRFVADIVQPNTAVLRDFSRSGKTKLIAIKHTVGMAILQPITLPNGIVIYSVVTAYTKRNPTGQQVTVIGD